MSASRTSTVFGKKFLAHCYKCVQVREYCHKIVPRQSASSYVPAVRHTFTDTLPLAACPRLYSTDQTALSQASQDPLLLPVLNTELKAEDRALLSEDYFGVEELFTVADLFKARVHLGHKEGLRHLHMMPYIYGNRLGQDIIDLDQTAEHLRLALNVLAHIAYRQGISLFICRNKRNAVQVENVARSCGEFSHCRKWRLGLFTNATFMYRSMTRLPDVCIFLGTLDNVFVQHQAVHEAAKMQVISIGVVDTNCDPRIISYPIPGNDDSPSAVKLYCDLFQKAIVIGKEKWKEDEKHLK